MGRLLQVIDVSTGEVIRQHQLEDEQGEFKEISMSPSGDRVAAEVKILNKTTKGSSVVWFTTNDESQSPRTLCEESGGLSDPSIGFTEDEHLVVFSRHGIGTLDTHGDVISDHFELNAYMDGELIGCGYSDDFYRGKGSYTRRILPSSSPSNVLFSTNDKIHHVDLVSGFDWDDAPIIDGPFLAASVYEPPGKHAAGTLLIWDIKPKRALISPSYLETMQFVEFAKPMAQAVVGGQGLGPSDAIHYMKPFSSEYPPHTKLVSSSEGGQGFDFATQICSVSPDSRYVLFVEGLDTQLPYIADLRTGQQYRLEPVEGEVEAADWMVLRTSWIWADLDGVPVLVDVGVPNFDQFPTDVEKVIRTFDARDGTLIDSTDFSFSDVFDALGLSTSEQNKKRDSFHWFGMAVSPRGRFIALSGIFPDAYSRVKDGISVCMIVDRESGEAINVWRLQEGVATDLVFSQDESQLAYISTPNFIPGASKGKICLMNVADVVSKTVRPGIEVAFNRNQPNPVPNPLLSFSADGKLLSFAGTNYVDLYDVDTATLLSRLDWPRIRNLLAKQLIGPMNSDVEYTEITRSTVIQFSGAAFALSGKELRINIAHNDVLSRKGISMIRIFDHSVLDAPDRYIAAKASNPSKSERTTSATRSPEERLHAVGDTSGDD